MNILSKKLFYFFAVSAFVLALASCGEKDPIIGPGPDEPGPEGPLPTDVINGTTIEDGNTLVGLISDASTGKGIPGVRVTDGYAFTVTDQNGVYQMKGNRFCRNVYYVTPSNYKINQNATTGLPEFFSTSTIDKYGVNRNDFKLTPMPVEENFTLLMVGDPQCQSDSQVGRYTNETIPDIQSTVNTGIANGTMSGVYAVTLGDVTHDNSTLWAAMQKSMSNVKVADGSNLSFFNCIGNHDHFSGAADDYAATANFVKYFGPTDYSFDRGNAHIVVMDNILCTNVEKNSTPDAASWDYLGGFTDAQMKWLKEDLDLVDDKANKLVIFCAHIPFRNGATNSGSSVCTDKHYSTVLNYLTQFKQAHIMIGHTHYSQNWVHNDYVCQGGDPIYEHVHGAACGSWWASNSDVIGGPNGYNVYTVKGSGITEWYNKGTNREANFQIRVYDGNQVYSGSKGYTYTWYDGGVGGSKNITAAGYKTFKNSFVAQIWDDDDKYWKVEMYKDGQKVGDFNRVPNGKCTNVSYSAYTFNELGKNTTTWTSKTASHYWYFKAESGNPGSESGWEVRATRTFPGSDVVKTYTCASITSGYETY